MPFKQDYIRWLPDLKSPWQQTTLETAADMKAVSLGKKTCLVGASMPYNQVGRCKWTLSTTTEEERCSSHTDITSNRLTGSTSAAGCSEAKHNCNYEEAFQLIRYRTNGSRETEGLYLCPQTHAHTAVYTHMKDTISSSRKGTPMLLCARCVLAKTRGYYLHWVSE